MDDINVSRILYSPTSNVDDICLLANRAVSVLKEKGLKISVAEGCTGGMVSQAITSIADATSVFDLGVCTYSNLTKCEFLNVSPVTLDTKGIVSYETAEAMVNGLKIRSGADLCVSVVGYAGPTGGLDVPVGTVYVGFYFQGRNFVRLFNLWGMGYDRDTIRRKTTVGILEIVISIVNNVKDYNNRRIFV